VHNSKIFLLARLKPDFFLIRTSIPFSTPKKKVCVSQGPPFAARPPQSIPGKKERSKIFDLSFFQTQRWLQGSAIQTRPLGATKKWSIKLKPLLGFWGRLGTVWGHNNCQPNEPAKNHRQKSLHCIHTAPPFLLWPKDNR
jgi:hypothetical protein